MYRYIRIHCKRFAVCAFTILVGAQPQALFAQMACLNIATVDVRGVTLFDHAVVDDWIDEHQGRCLGLPDFDVILETITTAYIEAGYVLSRAYLPQQDLSDGQLEISVVEGSLSQITINGRDEPRWSGTVFPHMLGSPVNLRDVEQGLDSIQNMPRWSAQMEFDSGQEPGESILEVAANTPKSTEFKLTTNNQGSADSGQWITGLSFDTTNLLRHNDTIEFGITRSLSPGPFNLNYDGDINRSGYFRIKWPHGRHSFQLKRTWSDYTLTVPGAISDIQTNGDTNGYGLQWKYLTFRDDKKKNYLTFDMDVSTNANFIAGKYIDASSRRITSVKLTYSGERPLWGGQLNYAVSWDNGVTWLGAEDASDQPANSPNAQYSLFSLDADFEKGFTLGGQQVVWSSTLSAQRSNDRLYGGQQYSIGGVSTVRGSRIALARGSSGILLRNEVSSALTQSKHPFFGIFEAYLGIDIGRVKKQETIDVLGGSAKGRVIGLRSKGGRLEFDLSYQEIFSISEGLQKPVGELMVSMSYVS